MSAFPGRENLRLQSPGCASIQVRPIDDYRYYRNDLLRFRFRLWKSFGSGSGFGTRSRKYFGQFFKKKKLHKSCPYNVRSSLFPIKVASLFYFWSFLLHFILNLDPNLVPVPDPEQKPKCFGSGFAKAKSYGSCAPGSGSTAKILST